MRGLLSAAIVAGVVGAAQADVLALSCTPALPYYCANIHIGCAGRSRIKTAPFEVTIDGFDYRIARGGSVQSGAVQTGIVQTGIGVPSESAVVIHIDGSNDWIRLVSGKVRGQYTYAERLYRKGKAMMARGRCATR